MELSFSRVWLPYIYLYGLGGFCFLAGLGLIIKSKGMDLKRKLHRKWLGILLFGIVWYMSLHYFLTVSALTK